MQRLGLTWVMVGGRPRCVSDFAALARRHRPQATCPVCDRRLTLKLGRVRRHHAAHAPYARCPATQPETALHLDLKFYLAAQLELAIRGSAELVIRRRCQGAGNEACDATHDESWVRDWDEVAVEARVASGESERRPDILLRRGGRPIGAIEVLVSHAVSDEKAAALASAGLPWVEIRADERLLDLTNGWRVGTALPVERIGSDQEVGGWRCDRHLRRATVLRAARVVDVYRDAGVRDRVIYRVDEQLVEGHVQALTLRRDGREIANQLADDSPASRRAAWTMLRAAYAADVRQLGEASGAFADSPIRWASGDAAANLVYEALSDLQPGDPTPLATRYPRRWFFARDRGKWFLPPDMRNVSWDRPTPDAFAAHPAWVASRAVVRERPAPETSWSSFIFASRPSVVSFGHRGRVTQDGPIVVLALDAAEPGARERAVLVLGSSADDDHVRRVARSLDEAGVDHLWLSHPLDWSSARSDLAWAAAGRDGRGRGVVLVDGLGVYRSEAFLRAFERGDPRIRPDVVRLRMMERVAMLGKPPDPRS